MAVSRATTTVDGVSRFGVSPTSSPRPFFHGVLVDFTSRTLSVLSKSNVMAPPLADGFS